MPTINREQWSSERVKCEIANVMKMLDIDRMPSFEEIKHATNSCALTNAISKRGGIYHFSEEMGVLAGKSETGLGRKYELYAKDIIESMGHSVIKMTTRFPYDLLVENGVKVDVKVSHLYKGKQGDFYTFNLEKPFATCDIYVLFCVGTTEQIYVVPSAKVIANTQISIGQYKSKYDIYKDRWDLLDDYVGFFRKVQ